jgi:ABC-2 type transport system permease protein
MIGTNVHHQSSEAKPQQATRRLSPSAVRSGGTLAMLLEQVRAELVQNARVPEFLVGIVVFPVMLFLMFGLPNAGQTLPEGTSVGAFLMGSFSAYGVLGIALFSFGVDIAMERGRGWLKLVRVTPMPAWVYFAGKFAMAMLFAVVTLVALFATAVLLAGVRLPLERWAPLFLTLLLGGMAFSTIGFALGYWASPRGASPIANLVYLPLSFASGLFIPLSNLPQFLQDLAPYLPTYHFGQLVWQAVGSRDDIALLAGSVSDGFWVHVLWLAGTFVVFGVLALLGYRRDQEERYA